MISIKRPRLKATTAGITSFGISVLGVLVIVTTISAIIGWSKVDSLSNTVNKIAGRVQRQAQRNTDEGRLRTAQFCGLQISRVRDLERQVVDTHKYLRSPAGQESTGINAAIKVSLPRTEHAAVRERRNTPHVCFKVTERKR